MYLDVDVLKHKQTRKFPVFFNAKMIKSKAEIHLAYQFWLYCVYEQNLQNYEVSQFGE